MKIIQNFLYNNNSNFWIYKLLCIAYLDCFEIYFIVYKNVINNIEKVLHFRYIFTSYNILVIITKDKYYLDKYFLLTLGLSTIWWVIDSSFSPNVDPTETDESHETRAPNDLVLLYNI